MISEKATDGKQTLMSQSQWWNGGQEDRLIPPTSKIRSSGFVFGNKGLMFNLTLEGSKMSKIKR